MGKKKDVGSSLFFSLLFMLGTIGVSSLGAISDFDSLPSSIYDRSEICFGLTGILASISVIFLIIGIIENKSNNRVVLPPPPQQPPTFL